MSKERERDVLPPGVVPAPLSPAKQVSHVPSSGSPTSPSDQPAAPAPPGPTAPGTPPLPPAPVRLSPPERAQRRLVRNIIVYVICLAALVAVFYYLAQ